MGTTLTTDHIVTWHGRPVTELTREELLVAIVDFAAMLEQERTFIRTMIEMDALFQ